MSIAEPAINQPIEITPDPEESEAVVGAETDEDEFEDCAPEAASTPHSQLHTSTSMYFDAMDGEEEAEEGENDAFGASQ